MTPETNDRATRATSWRLPAEPYLTRGDPDHWAPLAKITPGYLRDRFAGEPVYVYSSGLEQGKVRVSYTSLGEYTERGMERAPGSPEAVYLGEDEDLCRRLGIEGDIARYVAPLLPPRRVHEFTAFWMGPRGTYTGLHADPVSFNLLILLQGSKRFYVLPPAMAALLPRSDRYDGGAKTSPIDLFDPASRAQCPGLDLERALRFDMRPGDVLYVPRYWWHAVENTDDSVAVSFRAETPLSALRNLGVLLKEHLHEAGLYRRGDCTCHPEREQISALP